MNRSRRDRLIEEFQDKEYRHEYTESFFDTLIATQLRAFRNREGWTQKELGEKADTTQSGISEFENSDYSRWSVATLRRLARIFDVALEVRFIGFGKALREIQSFGPETVWVSSFKNDRVFRATSQVNRWTSWTSSCQHALSSSSVGVSDKAVISTAEPIGAAPLVTDSSKSTMERGHV